MSRPNGHFCLSVRWRSCKLSFPGDLFQFVTVADILLFGPLFILFLIVLLFVFLLHIVVESVSCRRHWIQQGIKFITSIMNMFKGNVRPDGIGLKMVSLDRAWFEHLPLYVFKIFWLYFFVSNFNQSSKYLTAYYKMPLIP